MNQKDSIVDLKQAASMLDFRMLQNGRRNTLKPGANESTSHFMMKAHIAHELAVRGLNFYAEAVFKNNAGRADIFVLEKRCAIEVLESEKELKAHKPEKYPCPIFAVRAGIFFETQELWKWLDAR